MTEAGQGAGAGLRRLALTKQWVSRLAPGRLWAQRATATFLGGWKMLAISMSPARKESGSSFSRYCPTPGIYKAQSLARLSEGFLT